MKRAFFLFFIFIAISCQKSIDEQIPTNVNNTDTIITVDLVKLNVPNIRFYLDNEYYEIVASPDSIDQRISIGYGSGNIIGTDTFFLSYSCNFIKTYDMTHSELEIEFYSIEKKYNLALYENAYYYRSNADLTKNVLFLGRKDYIFDNDLDYYPGVKISYKDKAGNYWTSIDVNQEFSNFSISSSLPMNTEEYGFVQKIEGIVSCTLKNTNSSSTIKLSGNFSAYYANPI